MPPYYLTLLNWLTEIVKITFYPPSMPLYCFAKPTYWCKCVPFLNSSGRLLRYASTSGDGERNFNVINTTEALWELNVMCIKGESPPDLGLETIFKNPFAKLCLNWSSMSLELRYKVRKVLSIQACPAVTSLLHIIGLYLRNYLLKKS